MADESDGSQRQDLDEQRLQSSYRWLLLAGSTLGLVLMFVVPWKLNLKGQTATIVMALCLAAPIYGAYFFARLRGRERKSRKKE